MKILLDDNLPHALRLELPGHDVFTVTYMRWKGISNGQLLSKAAENQFDVVITTDRGIEYQQGSLPCAVIVLMAKSNNIERIRSLLPQLLRAIQSLLPGTLIKIG
jgi:predicted nuclease of predicted toxin-antitoxin system